MSWLSTLVIGFVMLLFAIGIASMFYPFLFDPQQKEYQQQCMERNRINLTAPVVSFGFVECTIGTQYPEQLPDVKRNITVKTIQVLWFGDCKVLTNGGELLRAHEDLICMAQPNDNLIVYQRRTIENEITDMIGV